MLREIRSQMPKKISVGATQDARVVNQLLSEPPGDVDTEAFKDLGCRRIDALRHKAIAAVYRAPELTLDQRFGDGDIDNLAFFGVLNSLRVCELRHIARTQPSLEEEEQRERDDEISEVERPLPIHIETRRLPRGEAGRDVRHQAEAGANMH
ncbi:hypothetical protein D5400_11990 [Georhizobium profundi]|uniref:Uncharacterized protein n=1 Tax=Georhizobium profundi TaxID=2341112 RepID=A0A3Q8XQS6_9HYPH|nr:hypothetical protein D5400_11990 [Georhizobium profundi]